MAVAEPCPHPAVVTDGKPFHTDANGRRHWDAVCKVCGEAMTVMDFMEGDAFKYRWHSDVEVGDDKDMNYILVVE